MTTLPSMEASTENLLAYTKSVQLGHASLVDALKAGHTQSIINFLDSNGTTEEKYFDMSHVTQEPNEDTLKLFNSCREVIKLGNGRKYIWEGVRVEAVGIIAVKKFI